MEESVNKIIKKLNSDLNLIDTENFLNTIKDFDSQNSYELCKNFCDEINTVKNNITLNMTDNLNNLIKNKKNGNISPNKILTNSIDSTLEKKIKNLINNQKIKIKCLENLTKDFNTNLTSLNDILRKTKNTFTMEKLEKLFTIKNSYSLNIKNLINLNDNFLKENLLGTFSTNINNNNNESRNNNLNNKKNSQFNTITNFYTKLNANKKSQSPFDLYRDKSPNLKNKTLKKTATISLNNSTFKSTNNTMNNSIKKTTSFISYTNQGKKIDKPFHKKNLLSLMNTSSYNLSKDERENGLTSNVNYKEENQKLSKELNNFKQKFNEQKNLIEKLKKENNQLQNEKKFNSNILTSSTSSFNNLTNINNNNNISEHILKLNEKLSKLSDGMFNLTFLISSLQSKINSDFSEFNEIKNNFINLTNVISELKTIVLKISLDSQSTNTSLANSMILGNLNNNFNVNASIDMNNINDNENNEKINNLLKNIEDYKNEINNLNNKLNNEIKNKQNVENELNILKNKNESLNQNILNLNQKIENFEKNNLNENNNNIKNNFIFSSTSNSLNKKQKKTNKKIPNFRFELSRINRTSYQSKPQNRIHSLEKLLNFVFINVFFV